MDAAIKRRVWLVLGLAACGTSECGDGDEAVHPCLSMIEQPQPPALPPERVTPCLSPVPEPPPAPAPAPTEEGSQGRLEDPEAMRERVLASGRLPPDVVARLR